MQVVRSLVVASSLLMVLTMAPGQSKAQSVAFQPGVSQVSDGVFLNATPVVSADRRYVRLSLAPQFQTIDGFMNFPVPAAIAGGGNGGGLGGGGLGGLGGLGGGAGGGLAGGGLRSVGLGPIDYASWYPGLGVPREAMSGSSGSLPLKPLKATTSRSKKPLPDPEIVPIKKSK